MSADIDTERLLYVLADAAHRRAGAPAQELPLAVREAVTAFAAAKRRSGVVLDVLVDEVRALVAQAERLSEGEQRPLLTLTGTGPLPPRSEFAWQVLIWVMAVYSAEA